MTKGKNKQINYSRTVSNFGCLIWASAQNMTKLLFRNEEL